MTHYKDNYSKIFCLTKNKEPPPKKNKIAAMWPQLVIATVVVVIITLVTLTSTDHKAGWSIKTLFRVLAPTMTTSSDVWTTFLDTSRQLLPLNVVVDETADLPVSMVIVMNHPWCHRWPFADQIALGSLPRHLTQNLQIVANRGPPGFHPRNMVLDKLGRDHVCFIHPRKSGQLAQVKSAVQSAVEKKTSLLVYPEGKHARLYLYKDSSPLLAPFQSGIFIAAHELDVPMLPIVLPRDWRPSSRHTHDLHILPLVAPSSFDSASDFQSAVFESMSQKLLTQSQ